MIRLGKGGGSRKEISQVGKARPPKNFLTEAEEKGPQRGPPSNVDAGDASGGTAPTGEITQTGYRKAVVGGQCPEGHQIGLLSATFHMGCAIRGSTVKGRSPKKKKNRVRNPTGGSSEELSIR